MSDMVGNEELVNAVWERREMAKAAGDPLEVAYAELAFKGVALAGTDTQRWLWAKHETEMGEELLAAMGEREDDSEEDGR